MIDLYDGYKGKTIANKQIRVFDPKGVEIGIRSDSNTAFALAERHRRRLRNKVRPCILCGSEILSTGPHHRMCKCCRANPERMLSHDI